MLRAFLLAIMLAAVHDATAGAGPAEPAAALGRVLEQAARDGFSGSVYVERDGVILLDAAYGAAGGEPLTTSSRFWIASAGKPFVSAVVLLLVDRGALGLDDPIVEHLPDVPPDKAGITVRQLLAHASGLPQSYAAEGRADRYEALAALLAVAPDAPPGMRFIYSNANYQLAAALIETVTGRSYDDVLRTELLDPLGLASTGRAGWPGSSQVTPIDGPLPERLTRREWGAQGVYSTVRDLAAFHAALSGGELLTAAARTALFEPVVPISVGHSALGWFLSEAGAGRRIRFVRGNEDFGANALVYAYPDDAAVVVVLTHAGERDDGTSWSRAILEAIEGVLF